MIPEKAIKKFTKPSHREIVAGILLAYGFFPNTTEGIDQAKKFVSGLDRWIAPSNLPEYYDNIESDLMTGKETPGILAIRQALSDFYFNNTQISVEELPVEEIPVVVEVVEVEKQPEPQPDPEPEPVEIKVEVPVQSTPKLPKRIRLPRQKGRFVRRRQKSLAERMSAAFDKNLLDPLIEVIKNPPPGATPKTKKGVKSQKVVSKKKFTPPGVSGKSIATTSSSGGDLVDRAFSKISSAFKTAAAARKSFKESGGDPKTLRRRYFFDRALASEFGGDFLRRTRGTFSSAPDATQDPGLSKGERFAAVVNRDLAARPQMMRQEELFDVDQYTDKTPLQSILDLAKKTADKINGIESGFVRIEKSNKETSEAFKKISSSLSEVKNVYVKTTNNFKEFIDNKEEVIKIKEKINNFKRKQTDEIKIEQKERQTELFNDVAGVSDVQEVDQGLDEENVEAKDKGNLLTDLLGGAGELLGDIPGRGLRLGARARLLRRKVSGFGRGIGDRLGGIGKGISDRLGGIGKGIKGIGAKTGTKTGTKIGSKVGGGLLKTIGKKIPGVGLILGTLFSIDRFKNGDILGGLGEIASGVASIFPGPGTAISLGIDALLMGRDVTKPETKLSSGGIVAGEAGNEAVIPLNTAPAKKAIGNLKESSGGSLLGAVGPVLSAAAGIVRNPLYAAVLGPTVNPILKPLMSKYKVPVYSGEFGSFKIGKLKAAATQSKAKAESAKKAGDNPLTAAFGWLGNLFGGIGNAIGGAVGGIGNFFSRLFGGNGRQRSNPITLPPGQTDPAISNMSSLTGIHKQAADLIAGYESATSGGYNAMNRGRGGDSPEGPRHYFGKNLTDMTIGEVMALQKQGRLNAAGRYQFVGNTLPGSASKAGLSSSDKFSPINQDKMFVATLRSSGHRPWTGPWGLGKYTRQQLDLLDRAVSTPVESSTFGRTPQTRTAPAAGKQGPPAPNAVGDQASAMPIPSSSPSLDTFTKITGREIASANMSEMGIKPTKMKSSEVTVDAIYEVPSGSTMAPFVMMDPEPEDYASQVAVVVQGPTNNVIQGLDSGSGIIANESVGLTTGDLFNARLSKG